MITEYDNKLTLKNKPMKKVVLSIALLALISAGAAAKAGSPTSIFHKPRKVQIEVQHNNIFPKNLNHYQFIKDMKKHDEYIVITGMSRHNTRPRDNNQ
jgi:hypothetical protein